MATLPTPPDGRKIAFQSWRGGGSKIWVADGDGRNPVQLTTFDRYTGTPRWSPDGRRVVFESIEAGDWNLYVVDADGGAPQRLTPESSEENVGTWSHDGRWIYFRSNRGGGFYAQESWDGQHLYYTKSSAPTGIWRVPVEGGEATEVVHEPALQWNDGWRVRPDDGVVSTDRLVQALPVGRLSR